MPSILMVTVFVVQLSTANY